MNDKNLVHIGGGKIGYGGGEHDVSASGSNELLCSMPKELTAENGAKGLLSGEFFIDVEFYDDEGSLHCRKQVIDWITIKEIYAMAVKHLAT